MFAEIEKIEIKYLRKYQWLYRIIDTFLLTAAISGDMLTTSGIKTSEDIAMLKELGFEVYKSKL